jgi:hypothetical protein
MTCRMEQLEPNLDYLFWSQDRDQMLCELHAELGACHDRWRNSKMLSAESTDDADQIPVICLARDLEVRMLKSSKTTAAGGFWPYV